MLKNPKCCIVQAKGDMDHLACYQHKVQEKLSDLAFLLGLVPCVHYLKKFVVKDLQTISLPPPSP